jgi:hypothetical protein
VVCAAFWRALEAFFAVLDRHTLADLMRNEKQLTPLLFPPPRRCASGR